MSAVLHQTQDPTAGFSLASTRADNLEVTRYIFTAGDFLDPDRKFRSEHLRYSAGGEELQTHCLRRAVGGFLEKGKLTPMEVWTEAMPAVLIADGAERDTVRVVGPATMESLGMKANRPGALAGVGAALTHVKFYPGDEILAVMRANDGKGIVEVKALAGQVWWEDEEEAIKKKETPTVPGVAQLLNRDFFPTQPPATLRGLRQVIEDRASRSEWHAAAAPDMLTSCDQFHRWAETRLAFEHELLRTRRSHQHTYTYSPLARELLKQLEMKPQDSILEQMSSGISIEQIQQVVAATGGQGINPALIGQIAGEVARQFLAAQKAEGNLERVTDDEKPAPPAGEQPAEQTPAQKRAETLARKKAEEEKVNGDPN